MCKAQDKKNTVNTLNINQHDDQTNMIHGKKNLKSQTEANRGGAAQHVVLLSLTSTSSTPTKASSEKKTDYSQLINALTTRTIEGLYLLNANSKWILYIANTLALWMRPDRYEGPLIVFGAIAAIYLTDVLKKIINQARPEGSIAVDPGMPSAHSLTSFFLAAAWASILPTQFLSHGLLWSMAGAVAYLRVFCGYHSWAQIIVGAGLGSLLGSLWMELGQIVYHQFPVATFYTGWGLYLSLATFFMIKNKMNYIKKPSKHVQ